MAPRRAARIVRQVGAALDAAHARGLVHRDVKPANVLLARADHVYLSDFGLAKNASDAGGLTRQGSIVARAEYVAPEQIIDDRVDALTDVYALGLPAVRGADRGGARSPRSTGWRRDDGPRRRPAALGPGAAPGPASGSSTTWCGGRWPRTRPSATPRRATSGRPRSSAAGGKRRATRGVGHRHRRRPAPRPPGGRPWGPQPDGADASGAGPEWPGAERFGGCCRWGCWPSWRSGMVARAGRVLEALTACCGGPSFAASRGPLGASLLVRSRRGRSL